MATKCGVRRLAVPAGAKMTFTVTVSGGQGRLVARSGKDGARDVRFGVLLGF